jgi:conjugative relaxase-like TrwC/TraI family protein
MLTISKPLNAGQAQTYHAKEFTSAEQNYWKEGDPALGEWQGELAQRFGLAGAVDAQHFARLSEGQNPITGEQLVRNNNTQEYTNATGQTVKPVEHRAGWDATFSAPKSVSLTALVGGDERVREAHRNAVTTALTELERYTQARIGGNNPAETTGKFVAAKFEHDTARPVDGYAAPQLHTHAVIFNITERADGSSRALQERGFFDTQQFATAVYQAELTFQLRNLGYELTTGKSGAPEIAGYTQEYLDASSPRRQQIEEALARTGFSGPEAAEISAHNSRDKKQIHTPAEVIAAHRQIAGEFGHQADRVVAEARSRGVQQDRVPDAPKRAQEAVTYARDRSFEREAVADQRTLLRDALRRGMGDVPYREIRTNFDQRHASQEFQTVPGQKHATGQQFTTRETIAMERAIIGHMQQGQDSVQPVMPKEQAAAQAATRDFLNPTQKAAIEEILTSRDRIHGLQGLAGTGKTTTLESIREGAEKSGFLVEGFAPTSRAAGQLRDAKIDAGTLQSFLAKHQDNNPTEKHLYMVDESSLTSTRQMRDFLEKIGLQDRVLLIGDTSQHQGVDAGKPFEQLQSAGMQTSQLDKIMRQKDPELLKAVEHLSKNETEQGIKLLSKQGRITEIVDPAQRIDAIAKDYARQPENTLVVSPDNKSRQQINEAIRGELQSGGSVSKDNHTINTLTQRSDMTGADRTWASRYDAGDILKYTTGSKEHGIERGSYATVTAVHQKDNQITVRRDDGQSVTYDPKRLQGISAFRETSREFAQGDRVQFTGINRELGVANRDLGTITKIEGAQLSVRMDGDKPREITFDGAQMRHLDHGYAVTSHSSQGLTTGRVLVNMDTTTHAELINTRFAYVSVSRASQDARIYTNDATQLGDRLATNISKSSAVAVEPKPNPQQEKVMEHAYTKAEELRHQAPIQLTFPKEAAQFDWKQEQPNGTQSYQHKEAQGWLHIDPKGQCHDTDGRNISPLLALDKASDPERYQQKQQSQDIGQGLST